MAICRYKEARLKLGGLVSCKSLVEEMFEDIGNLEVPVSSEGLQTSLIVIEKIIEPKTR